MLRKEVVVSLIVHREVKSRSEEIENYARSTNVPRHPDPDPRQCPSSVSGDGRRTYSAKLTMTQEKYSKLYFGLRVLLRTTVHRN